MDPRTKRTWAEVSLANLENNYKVLRSMIPVDCKYLSLVKANAYGHGMVPIAKKMEQLGADYFAVACLDEAVELRENGITTPVLILGITPEEFAGDLVRYDITQAVSSPEMARAISDQAVQQKKTAKVHFKLDTGMSRVGFPAREECAADTADTIAQLAVLPGLDAEGIFTHFAAADVPEKEEFTMRQFTRYLDMVDLLAKRGVTFAIRHCAASSAIVGYPCTHLDMVRPGIIQFGYYPDGMEGMTNGEMKPLMTLKTRIVLVKDLPAGTPLSYGCTHTLARDSRIATVPIGYGDGLPRLLSNRGQMLVNGCRCNIVGRICMDMCMLDVTDVPGVKAGDVAIVFGPELPLEEKTEAVGTIQHEILCDIAPRVPRVYID